VNIEDIALLTGLMTIPFMLLFLRKQLFKKQVFIFLLVISIILTLIESIEVYYSNNVNFNIFLLCPLYDLIILYPFLWLFRKIKKREPKDAPRQFIPYDDGLWSDRLFYMAMISFWLIIPLALLAYYK
jgi:hypothetical protein